MGLSISVSKVSIESFTKVATYRLVRSFCASEYKLTPNQLLRTPLSTFLIRIFLDWACFEVGEKDSKGGGTNGRSELVSQALRCLKKW